MTKLELDMLVNYKFRKGTHRKCVSGFTNIIIEQFSQALEGGGRIDVRGFGSWSSKCKLFVPRRNPSTLVSFIKDKVFKIRFKPSPVLYNAVNKDKEDKPEYLGVLPKVPEPLVEEDESLDKAIEKVKAEKEHQV